MAGHSRSKNGVASLACGPGHPRLWTRTACKRWMPGTRPGMTRSWNASWFSIAATVGVIWLQIKAIR